MHVLSSWKSIKYKDEKIQEKFLKNFKKILYNINIRKLKKERSDMWHNTKSFYGGNQIETETTGSFLVKIPKSDYKFWISKKQTRWTGTNVTFGINETWTYKIFKNGKGKYNKFDIVGEREVTGLELLEMFNGKAS